jgi:hypothetical protein
VRRNHEVEAQRRRWTFCEVILFLYTTKTPARQKLPEKERPFAAQAEFI